MDKRFQVFVSSTFMDLEKEREIAVQTLMKMNCIPSGMELFPAADIEQFEFIKKIIDDCDYYLLIIGGRYGSMTEEGISYTEKEYDYAIKKGIKVIAFLHKNPKKLSVENSEVSKETIDKLEAFRTKVSTDRLVEFWENKDQLGGMICLGLQMLIRMHTAIGWVRANKTSTVESLEEINALQKRNHELEEKLNDLIKSTSQSTLNHKNLASLDSYINLTLVDNLDKEVLFHHSITWIKILKSISSIVFNSISEYNVSTILKDLCLKELKISNAPEYTVLSPESLNIIKIQFYALGYICFAYESDPDGDPNDTYPVWKTTVEALPEVLNVIAIKNI